MRAVFRLQIVVGAVLTALIVAGGFAPPSAEAANGGDFKAGYIIDDSKFFDAGAMSASDVQSFLEAKVRTCKVGATCLRGYRETTRTLAATPMCSQYPGGVAETAATIIWKVAQTCGISPKVLLVMLQKEQGLVLSTAPSAYAYRSAMGAGCPDTAACDSNYYGFFNQVHYGAFLLKRYTQPAGTGAGTPYDTRFDLRYPVGQTSAVLLHPNAAKCGRANVFISNQATHALYIYTPYQPNAPALQNLYGAGNDCSSYGNRNFWAYYTDWFGPTTGNDQPVGSIDAAVATSGGLSLRGWVLDPNTASPTSVRVLVDGAAVSTPTADLPRGDIATVFPNAGAKHGFDLTVPLAEGVHSVCLVGVNVGVGADALLGCRTTEVHTTLPWGSIDTARVNGSAVDLRGWAIDPNTTAPIWIHAYVDGTFAGGFLASGSRPDIAVAYPSWGGSHGYSFSVPLAAGNHSVCLFGINVGDGSNTQLGCSAAYVPGRTPVGYLDSAKAVTGGVSLTGWTLDPSATTSTFVHVYSDGVFASGTLADGDRADLARAYPSSGRAHGFTVTAALSNGSHRVCAYGLNVQRDRSALLGCRDVVVATPQPVGHLDAASVSGGTATVAGWSFDPSTPSGSTWVHVYVDGRFATGLPANASRPDVARSYPTAGPNRGFGGQFAVASGRHSVCAYGLSADQKRSTPLGCTTVG